MFSSSFQTAFVCLPFSPLFKMKPTVPHVKCGRSLFQSVQPKLFMALATNGCSDGHFSPEPSFRQPWEYVNSHNENAEVCPRREVGTEYLA